MFATLSIDMTTDLPPATPAEEACDLGSLNCSSRRRTANGGPLRVDELVGYLREALEPPTPAPAPVTIVETIDT